MYRAIAEAARGLRLVAGNLGDPDSELTMTTASYRRIKGAVKGYRPSSPGSRHSTAAQRGARDAGLPRAEVVWRPSAQEHVSWG